MGLENFKSFVKNTKEEKKLNNDVWLYTRVSSKDQEANKSLENQKEFGYKYAKEHNYNITNTFGGTYESASGDFTRKEFSKLIQEIRDSNKKPFAILIYTMSRFSRTGGNGISLANELIEVLGVNLIEVSTGKNTITKDGRLEIFSSLIKANQENLDRLKVTIPGMKSLLKNGGWLGNVPMGYTMYGSRVRNKNLYSATQEIKLNETGEKLRQAWKWKLEGEKDFEIRAKLSAIGIDITKQKLSAMWRNPFYCGVSVNKMLDEPVKGRWDKMVSEEDFLIVQEILKGNNFGFKQEKANPLRPLNAFIHCSECGGRLTGYEVKKKKVHYYKCQKCKGITINAETTKRAKAEGAHNLFLTFLKDYQLPKELEGLFKEQLKLTYETLNGEKLEEETHLQKELEKHKDKLKIVRKNYALGELEKDIYLEVKEEIEGKINEVEKKLHNVTKKISNLDSYIDLSLDVVSNTSNYWALNDLATKKRIQETAFPNGVVIDVKNRSYLTKKTNLVFDLTRLLSANSEAEMKNGIRKNLMPSSVVERIRPISNRLTKDMLKFKDCKRIKNILLDLI